MSSTILGYSAIPTATTGVNFIPKFKTTDLINEDVIKTHRLQRDHKKRLKKMQVHFRKKLPTLYNFSIMNVTNHIFGNYEGETINVEPGIYMVDGHTRREDIIQSLKKGEDNYPPEVSVTMYDVHDFSSYKDIYYSFDSDDAVEKSNEKIVAACQAMGIFLNAPTGKSGGFGTALNIAYPGSSSDSILSKIAYFKDEIIALDEIGLFKPSAKEFKSQCLMAAGLMALKYYNQPDASRARIIGGLSQLALAKKTIADLGDKTHWYGLDMIQYEFLVAPGTWIPAEYHRKTSYTALLPQMNFFWYCIENYMNKKKKSKDGGVKSNMFIGKYDKYSDALLAANPIIGYTSTVDEFEEEFDDE